VLLLAAIAAVTHSPAPLPSVRAEARIQIVRGARVGEESWTGIPPNRRREEVIVDVGRRAILRLIEFE
jgi:hypothetical protein